MRTSYGTNAQQTEYKKKETKSGQRNYVCTCIWAQFINIMEGSPIQCQETTAVPTQKPDINST